MFFSATVPSSPCKVIEFSLQNADLVEQAVEVCRAAFTAFERSINAVPVAGGFTDLASARKIIHGLLATSGILAFAFLDPSSSNRLLGSNFVDLRAPHVATIGPISVDPAFGGTGAGKTLMMAAVKAAQDRGRRTILLQQHAGNTRSFSLYCKVGFKSRHLCASVAGSSPPSLVSPPGVSVTPMALSDVEECQALHTRARGGGTGWERSEELRNFAAGNGALPALVARGADGRLIGYTTGFGVFGHSVIEGAGPLWTLLRRATELHREANLPPPRLLFPAVECADLLAAALDGGGMKVDRLTTMMSLGEYDPSTLGADGCYVLPSMEGW